MLERIGARFELAPRIALGRGGIAPHSPTSYACVLFYFLGVDELVVVPIDPEKALPEVWI